VRFNLVVGSASSTAGQSLARTGGLQTFEKVNNDIECASYGSR